MPSLEPSYWNKVDKLTVIMKSLALALLFCALLPLTSAQCFVNVLKQDATHCQDDVDGTWHAVGSSWRNSKCWDCSCGGCCAAYSTPVRIPDDCVKVMDWDACEYKVHMRNDPSVSCPVFASVGK